MAAAVPMPMPVPVPVPVPGAVSLSLTLSGRVSQFLHDCQKRCARSCRGRSCPL